MHAWTCHHTRVDCRGTAPVDRLGARRHHATTSGAPRAADPGQCCWGGQSGAGAPGADESNHRPPLAGRFATQRCAGLQDRPRRGRPKTLTPATRALVVALACERPADREVPLRRYSLSELTVEVANRLPSDDIALSQTAIWRVLAHDALRPWRYRSWITPRDPHFLERAGPVLDLYACQWQGRPLWADEYVLSADEKTSIQVRRRLIQPSQRTPPGHARRTRVRARRGRAVSGSLGCPSRCRLWPLRTEDRQSRFRSIGRRRDESGAVPLGTPRVLDRGQRLIPSWRPRCGGAAGTPSTHRHRPYATYASWLNQVEIYFSIIQRKVLTPNDYSSLEQLEHALHAFATRYSALGKPFAWCFTRQDLERRLRDPQLQPDSTLSAAA